MSRARVRWATLVAITALEWRIQRREPATVLYALVFLLLTFGFVSSGAVELVRDRASVPKLAPLAITLAFGGLTAFGQVITTMVTASAFLRDAAWRTDGLLFTTPLDRRLWVIGRWAGALLVLALVSLAMPAGVLLGALAPWTEVGTPRSAALLASLRAWAALTLPTIAAVGTLLALVAVRTRHLLGVLAAALALLFLWQGCEAVRRAAVDNRVSPTLAQVASLADPFGTVAVQQVTAAWSDAERATQPVPWWGPVGLGRSVWLAGALVLGALGLRAPVAATARASASSRGPSVPAARAQAMSAEARPARVLGASGGRVGRGRAWFASHGAPHIARTMLAWTWRETGWRVIAGLGALNVLAHALTAGAPAPWDVAGVLALVREHARLFLILLATIYAGELLWRDHDARVHALVASTPMSSARLVLGRVAGLATGQALLVALLVASATLGGLVAAIGADVPDALMSSAGGWWWRLPVGTALWLWLPFVQWLVLSLLVHVLVRHKVIAHLLLIAGWVAAVALDANGVSHWWWRFADPPALHANAPLPLAEAAARGAWWSVVCGVGLLLTVWRWPRTTSPR